MASTSRSVRFPAEDSRKMGRECLEGRGRPTFQKGNIRAFQYLENAHIENALGCNGYVKYDFETSQYCCSAKPSTAGKLIEFILMVMETMSNSLLNTKIYNPRLLEYMIGKFKHFIQIIPIGERRHYIPKYLSYLKDIRKNQRETNEIEMSYVDHEDEVNREHHANMVLNGKLYISKAEKEEIIKKANTAYESLPPFEPINYRFGKLKSVRKTKKSIRK